MQKDFKFPSPPDSGLADIELPEEDQGDGLVAPVTPRTPKAAPPAPPTTANADDCGACGEGLYEPHSATSES